MAKENIVITTGGTGGHMIPALSVAKELLKLGFNVHFITDERGSKYFKEKDITLYKIKAQSITGRNLFGKIKGAFSLLQGACQSMLILKNLKPKAVIGFAGYASIPAVMVAHLVKIPVILHEQNSVLGRANRILAKGSQLIITTFKDTALIPKDIPTFLGGLPLRKEVLDYKNTPYPTGKNFNLLIFGGSQGASFFARPFSKSLINLPSSLKSKLDIVQQVRPEDADFLKTFYKKAGFHSVTLESFFNDMPKRIADAHLVIARSGASSIYELSVIARAGIFIPYPTSADAHQKLNAIQYCNTGSGWVLDEKDFNVQKMTEWLEKLIKNPTELKKAGQAGFKFSYPNAEQRIAQAIKDITQANKKS